MKMQSKTSLALALACWVCTSGSSLVLAQAIHPGEPLDSPARRVGAAAADETQLIAFPILQDEDAENESDAGDAEEGQDADENAGQELLDEATGLKLDANTPNKLGEVIDLCEQALEAGLDEGNSRLAKQVLAASALQRAQMFVQRLPRVANNPAAVRRLRDQTMKDLKKAVDNNPQLAEAYVLMANMETLPGGSREQAIEYVDQAIEQLDDKPVDQSQAYMLRARLQADPDDKLDDLKKAIEADSTNEDAWQARVAILMAMGKLEEAIQDAESMLEKDEENVFAMQAAIQSLLGLEKTDEAIQLLSTRIAKDADNGALYRTRGRAYIINDELDKALDDLNRAIELNDQDAEALVMRGQIYYDQGEIDKAKRDISDSLLIKRDSVQGVWMRALVAAREQRYADAIKDMELLVRADPTNQDWILQLASFYQMDDRPRLAVKLLDRLLQDNPDNWRAMRLRGDAKLSYAAHQSAVADYKQAIEILEQQRAVPEDQQQNDLDYSGVLNNLAWVLATSPKDEIRDGETAVDLATKACDVTEYKKAHILSTLAAAYAEVGDFENARKWAAKAVEIGTEEDHDQLEQLQLELESYEADKPWREEQQVEENDRPLVSPSETIDT